MNIIHAFYFQKTSFLSLNIHIYCPDKPNTILAIWPIIAYCIWQGNLQLTGFNSSIPHAFLMKLQTFLTV